MDARSGRSPDGAEAARSCEICGGTRFEVIATRDRKDKPLETAICPTCGLVSHLRIPSERELEDFYASGYRESYHGERTPSPRRVMRAWRRGRHYVRLLGTHLRPGQEVFEVGAGIGCTVKAFEMAAHPASGIEPGEGFQEFSRNRLRAGVRRVSLYDLPAKPSHDFILLVHVIEHFSSPRRALKQIHALLRPGGQLYVECPNLAAPFALKHRLFHFAHVYNFTPSSLRMLAERCRFRLERQFGDEHDPNIGMLFRRAEEPRERLDRDNFRRTLEAMDRYTALTYHLRRRYLSARLGKLAGYALERVAAPWYVRRLLARCESGTAKDTTAAAGPEEKGRRAA